MKTNYFYITTLKMMWFCHQLLFPFHKTLVLMYLIARTKGHLFGGAHFFMMIHALIPPKLVFLDVLLLTYKLKEPLQGFGPFSE